MASISSSQPGLTPRQMRRIENLATIAEDQLALLAKAAEVAPPDHSQCHTEISRLCRMVRLLESQLHGHWLEDTQDYDWGDDSLPWSTNEG